MATRIPALIQLRDPRVAAQLVIYIDQSFNIIKSIFSNNIVCCTQSVNQELQDALNEREQLKNQVQDYLLEVKRIEELLSSKVRQVSALRLCMVCYTARQTFIFYSIVLPSLLHYE